MKQFMAPLFFILGLTVTGSINAQTSWTVTIQPIIVSNTDGSNSSVYFGDAGQQADITGRIDSIWSQAGIDIDWLTPFTWSNDFANLGTPGSNDPRPTSDLSEIVSQATVAGKINSNPLVLDAFFVEIAPGFSADPVEIFMGGISFIGGNGMALQVGDYILWNDANHGIYAGVVAHEIGHALGLDHLQGTLMNQPWAGDNSLNAEQIQTTQGSIFAVAIPEPSTWLLVLVALVAGAGVVVRRR